MRRVSNPARAKASPRFLDIGQILPFHLPNDDIGIALVPGNVRQHVQCRLADRYDLCPGLGIWQAQDARSGVHILPFQGLDFPETATGQEQQADAVCCFRLAFGLPEHLAQPGQFIRVSGNGVDGHAPA